MKSGELRLPYYKQGDDLSQILDTARTSGGRDLDRDNLDGTDLADCLVQHATMLEGAAELLKDLGKQIAIYEGVNFSVQADTHMITIAGPDRIIDRLLDAEFLMPDPFEGEDEEGE
jgi:hypothetical protein